MQLPQMHLSMQASLHTVSLQPATESATVQVLKAGMLRRELWRAQGTRPGLRTLILDAADTMLAMPGYQADLATLAPLVCRPFACSTDLLHQHAQSLLLSCTHIRLM